MLTARNMQVLRMIHKIEAESGWFPTVRELGQRLGVTSPSSTQHHLDVLVRHGFVETRGKRRRITELGRSALERRLVA